MRYRITGADSATGKEVAITLEAADEDDAQRLANYNGILVSAVEPEVKPTPKQTLDYRSPVAVAAPAAAPRPAPKALLHDGEKSFLSEGNIAITNKRVVIEGTTYALANITSVRMQSVEPDRLWTLGILTIGAIFALCTIGYAAQIESKTWRSDLAPVFGAAVLSAGLFALGGWLWVSAHTRYVLVLSSSSGEVQAMWSESELDISRLVAAINLAIAS